MKKTKIEIKYMASVITKEKGKYMFNIKEIAAILGISRETARKLVSNLSCAEIGNTNKYYIYDVLEFVYK